MTGSLWLKFTIESNFQPFKQLIDLTGRPRGPELDTSAHADLHSFAPALLEGLETIRFVPGPSWPWDCCSDAWRPAPDSTGTI